MLLSETGHAGKGSGRGKKIRPRPQVYKFRTKKTPRGVRGE